jgi:uncharacterized protein (TIGR02996 family)
VTHVPALLAAVHANPEEVDVRLVYADALSDAGDPRGEFIALQCGRGDVFAADRERELLAEHGTAWLGRLAPLLDPAKTTFERGFLSVACVKKVPRPKLLATAGDPTWATVTRLEFDDRMGGVAMKNGAVVRGARVPAAAVLLHPIMRALREVSGIDGDVLVTLCREGVALPIRSISASTYPLLERGSDDMWQMEASARSALETATGLPQLRRLDLHGYPCDAPDMKWLLRSPLAGRLDRLRLENFGGTFDRWAAHARDADPKLGELVVDYWGIARFTRSSDGSLGELEVDAANLTWHQRAVIDAALARIPKGALQVRFRS